jgi:hypothetical protein
VGHDDGEVGELGGDVVEVDRAAVAELDAATAGWSRRICDSL